MPIPDAPVRFGVLSLSWAKTYSFFPGFWLPCPFLVFSFHFQLFLQLKLCEKEKEPLAGCLAEG